VVGCLKGGLETLVGRTDMHILIFLLIQWVGLLWNIKFLPQILFGDLQMCLQSDYEKLILMGHQSWLWACLAMFLITTFGALVLPSLLRNKSSLMLVYPKYIEFWKLGTAQNETYEMKMKPYVEYWEDILLHLLSPYPVKMPFFWKGFGCQVIGNPIVLGLHCQPLLLVLIQKTQFNAFIVGQGR
jgi:hypothetical protein